MFHLSNVVQFVRWYDVHAISCRIVSNHRDIFPLLDETVGYFACSERISPPCVTLNVSLLAGHEFPAAYSALAWKELWKTTEVACAACGDALLFEYTGKGYCVIDLTHGSSQVCLKTPDSMAALRQRCREMVLPCLFWLIHGKGRCRIHAAAVSSQGRGIVIAGMSGQGKTTVLLHLLRAGVSYMADDAVFLRERQPSPEILALPGYIGVSAQIAAWFPELRDLLKEAAPDARGKYRLNVAPIYQRPPVRAAPPALLIFPEITPAENSILSPLPKMEAALRLFPENVFPIDRQIGRQHFHLLSRLIQAVQCYHLRLGRDMQSIAPQILERL